MATNIQGSAADDVLRLQRLIRTTMRALAVSTIRARDASSTGALIARVHHLNESLARREMAECAASACVRRFTDQTRAELAVWERRTAAPIPAEVSPIPAEVSPIPAEVSPTPADISPMPADVSPMHADISPMHADVSPMSAEVLLPGAAASPESRAGA